MFSVWRRLPGLPRASGAAQSFSPRGGAARSASLRGDEADRERPRRHPGPHRLGLGPFLRFRLPAAVRRRPEGPGSGGAVVLRGSVGRAAEQP